MLERPPLSLLLRAGLVESVHRGAVAVTTTERTLFSIGPVDPPELVFPRSAIKPFQALPLLEDGLDRVFGLDPREVALTTASHGGDESHVAVAQSLMAKSGLRVEQLLCGVHAPMDRAATRRMLRAGQTFTSLHHNCSGKHLSMLMQARHLGASLPDYTDPDHPVQTRIRDRIALFAGIAVDGIKIGIDGCSAPAFALPLAALARAMARFADPTGLPEPTASAATRLFDIAVAEPHFVSGSRRIDLAVARTGHGRAFCKIGAEGVLALALRPPRPGLPAIGIAIKVEDGNERGYFQPALHLLRWLGFDPPADAAELPNEAAETLLNYRGLEVGKIAIADPLLRLPASPWS